MKVVATGAVDQRGGGGWAYTHFFSLSFLWNGPGGFGIELKMASSVDIFLRTNSSFFSDLPQYDEGHLCGSKATFFPFLCLIDIINLSQSCCPSNAYQ